MLSVAGYEGVTLLHTSNSSQVYRAVRSSDGQPVVLKSVAPGAVDPRARWRLGQEHRILAALEGAEGVVAALGLETTELGPTLALPALGDGSPLRRPGQVMSLPRFFDVACQVASAVATIHQHGITHRDINPNNIIFDAEGERAWLIDFGHATRLERAEAQVQALGGVEGTLGFLSPEQTGRMNRSVDWRTDLYSLGATFYALLVGRAPFESEDPVELLHATVAQTPQPLTELRPELPAVLCQIVLRLLSKDAEDRYQDASALVDDLQECKHRLAQTGEIAAFPLGRTDRRGRFVLPERLYGRGEQVQLLVDALKSSRAGKRVVVGVKGPPGAGKSSLVRELTPHLDRSGLLASGVCNPVQRSPYAPIVQLLREIRASVLTSTEDVLVRSRERLAAVVGRDGGLLKQLLPEIEDILGPQPEPPTLPGAQSRDRVLGMLVRMLRGYHQPDSPLVVFLDDLQWVDSGSLAVIERLLGHERGGPLLILAWRDNEVGEDHPLRALITPDLPVIEPSPLTAALVADMLADTLDLEASEVLPLAKRAHDKTNGNAFFVRQFLESLHADGLLSFDNASRRWSWSIEEIDAAAPTSNVAQLLARRLGTLAESAQQAVGFAACAGKRADLDILVSAAGGDRAAMASGHIEAVNSGLITPVGPAWGELQSLAAGLDVDVHGGIRFVHDQVRAAARDLLDESARDRAHLALGDVLFRRWKETGGDPFASADVFLPALRALPAEQADGVAELLLAAGRRAITSAAFEAALVYLEAGIGLIGPTTPQPVAFQLHLRAAEAHLMVPEHEPQADLPAGAMEAASTVLERIDVQRVRMLRHTARYEFADTVRLTVEALSWVGVNLPSKANFGHVAAALGRTAFATRKLDANALAALPDCDSPEVAAALRLLVEAQSSAYYTDALLLPVLICRTIDLTLKHGVAPYSAAGFGTYGFIKLAVHKDLAAAQQWGRAARALIERFDARSLHAKVEVVVVGFIDSRTKSLATLSDSFKDAGWAARECGDAEYTGLCAFNRTQFAFNGGLPLPGLVRLAELDLASCVAVGQAQSQNAVRVTLQIADCLAGRAPSPVHLRGDRMVLDDMLAQMEDGGDRSGATVIHIQQARLAFLGDDTELFLKHEAEARKRLADLPASPDLPPFHMVAALALIRILRESGRRSGPELSRARKDLAELKRWAADGPLSFAHKVLLVEAELADFGGDVEAGRVLFDKAINAARTSGILHEEALAQEQAARAALRNGQLRRGSVLLQEARSSWEAWGATTRRPVLDALGESVPGVQLSLGATLSSTLSGTLSTQSPGTATGTLGLDREAVVRAARAVSTEIHLESLLRTLMRIVIENAGATYGMLLLQRDTGLGVVATAAMTQQRLEIDVMIDAPRRHGEVRPNTRELVDFVTRTRTAIVVDDGHEDTRFFGGVEVPPRSVLCAPVTKGSELIGVLLLENDLTRAAFTEDRHELVAVICGQAAVSIENASLYADLEAALDRQRALARSFERFVPKEFLVHLGRDSILDVALGDQVEREMTILFMDIRNFTTLSEQLTAGETFSMVNGLLARLGPIIRRHGGFIDKYIGDAIMALFPGSPDDGVGAALSIQRSVAELRESASGPPQSGLAVGVGVHHGTTMLGTIGESQRMDSTVISDAVNVASRLEGLTKALGVGICISEATAKALKSPERFALKALGGVDVKGKAEQLQVYSVLDPTE